MDDGLSVKPRHFSIPYMLVPVLAVLVTGVTGFWQRTGDGTLGGTLEYGFPLPWKTSQIVPTCASCSLPTSYNWVFFLVDAVFYAAIGYGIISLYTRSIWKQKDHFTDPGKAAMP